MAKPAPNEAAKVILWHNHVPERTNTTRYRGFITRLKRLSPNMKQVQFIAASLSDCVIEIDNHKVRIIDTTTGEMLTDAALHIFRNWQQQPAMAASIAAIAEETAVPFFDRQVLGAAPGKFAHHTAFWAHQLEQPLTVLLPDPRVLEKYLNTQSALSLPFVLKASNGQKGKDNFLVTTQAELKEAVAALAGTNVIAQEFIANKGDWRLLAFGGRVRYGFFRRNATGGYLNNTSTGGEAKEFTVDKIDPAIVSLAERAAVACKVEIAGVDIIPTQRGNYLLEVNYPPQIATGAFVESKMKHFGDFIEEVLVHRYPKKKQLGAPKTVIGRHVLADIPELHAHNIPAKVDTGAYTTSLSARNIHMESSESVDILCFETQDIEGHWHQHRVKTFQVKAVRNVHGRQSRYAITTAVRVQGREVETVVNLVDRSNMKYGLLLGRKILRGSFVVNVELSQKELV